MKFILTTILVLFLTYTSAQRTGILFSSLSESGQPQDGWDAFQRCVSNRLIYNGFIKRAGNQSTRFQSRALDTSSCSTVLSQLILNDTNIVKYERWYGFSVYFSSGFTDKYQGHDNFLEFYRSSTEENPPLVLSYNGRSNGTGYYPTGDYLSILRWMETPENSNSPYHIYIHPLWTIQRNSWNDIVMNIKWSNDNTGSIRIWLNGRYVYGYIGITNYTTNILRIGSNFWNWSRWPEHNLPIVTNTRELFIDEFRIGSQNSSYLDVFPDSNDPAPNPTSANQFYQVVNNRIEGQKITFKVQQDTIWQSNWELRNATTGKRVMSGNFRLAQGYRTYIMNLPFTIQSGNYIFLVGTNRFMHVRKLTKI